MAGFAGRLSIVVVEDDAWSAKYLCASIRRHYPQATVHVLDGSDPAMADRCVGVDAVLLDMALGAHSGVDFCARLRRLDGAVAILGLTSFLADRYRADLAAAGAQGILHKEELDDVITALSSILGGHPMPGFPTPQAAQETLRHRDGQHPPLTAREQEVLDEYRHAHGDARTVAERLGIAVATVHKHLQNIRGKKRPVDTRGVLELRDDDRQH